MQTIPKKQVMAKAPIKVAATPTQKSSSSEESSSEEEEQKKPVKKKPGDWTQGMRLSNPLCMVLMAPQLRVTPW